MVYFKRRRVARRPMRFKRRVQKRSRPLIRRKRRGVGGRLPLRRRIRAFRAPKSLSNLSFPQCPGYGLQRIKCITNSSVSWGLNKANPYTTLLRDQAPHTNWLPSTANQSTFQTSFWNGFQSKKLIKYVYKFSNFRIFMTTNVGVSGSPFVSPVPTGALTSTTIEVDRSKCWFWRLKNENYASQVPNPNEEHLLEQVYVGRGKGKIWGSVPINSAKMNSFDGTYATLQTTQSGRYTNMDNYLVDFGQTGTTVGGNTPLAAGDMPNGDIFLTLDDPYPSQFYDNYGILATCQLTMTYDVTTYTTWSLRGHVN